MKLMQKFAPIFAIATVLCFSACNEDPEGNLRKDYDAAKESADNTIDGTIDAAKKGVEVIKEANKELKDL